MSLLITGTNFGELKKSLNKMGAKKEKRLMDDCDDNHNVIIEAKFAK